MTDITCMKISEEMKQFIDYLVEKGYLFSFAEYVRFALVLFMHDEINPNMHFNQFFANTFYYEPTKKKASVSFKITHTLNLRFKAYANKFKVNRSYLLRQAIDYASDYFLKTFFQDHHGLADISLLRK